MEKVTGVIKEVRKGKEGSVCCFHTPSPHKGCGFQLKHNVLCDHVRVSVSYTAIVVDVDVVQPAQMLVRLQEAGQLLVLCSRLGKQLSPLPLLHVPAKQEVSKVLQQKVTHGTKKLSSSMSEEKHRHI